MTKLKEYFKLFTYIFYPGMVLILYLAQAIEGKLDVNLIICPTDIIFIGIILGIYMLVDAFKILDYKGFQIMKRDDGRLKIPFLLLFMVIIVALMSLYDDLKVYFYLDYEIKISLLIVAGIWVLLLGLMKLLNKPEN